MVKKYFFLYVVFTQLLFTNCQDFKEVPSLQEEVDWQVEPIPCVGFTERIYHHSFSIKDKIYFCMGETKTGEVLSDFFQYDPETKNCLSLPRFPSPRIRATGFTIGSKIYIGTGQKDSKVYKDFWVFDTEKPQNDWQLIDSPFPGEARIGAIGFSINNMGYIFMGSKNSYIGGGEIMKNGWRYDPNGPVKWILLNDFPFAKGRSIAAGFVIDTSYYLIGGADGLDFRSEIFKFNAPSGLWEPGIVGNFPGGSRGSHIGFSIGKLGFVGLGENNDCDPNYNPLNDLWSFSPFSKKWAKMPNSPVNLSWTSVAVWKNSAYIFSGGTSNLKSCDSIVYVNKILKFTLK